MPEVIFVTLKPETKEKIDISQLKPSFVNALNMKTTEYGGKIILDLFADVQQYRGLDRLLSVNPTRLYGKGKIYAIMCYLPRNDSSK